MQSQPYISRVVHVGLLPIGGTEPVRIQSMTNTPTLDAERSYRQIMGLHEAGCELVRLTARNIREAENLGVIRNMLERSGVFMPLAADIHFNPRVAERAAAIVHKIRINPGNYLERQYFLSKENGGSKTSQVTPEMIMEEVGKLTGICREHGTAVRVGVNHGSLSERVLMQYGNTAEGMVFSAMEFLKVCRELDFHNLIVSMKSSHIPTMVKASLGIIEAMVSEGMDYPLHLGVTEAGAGEDGRLRSAAGIGPLLRLGIGDTLRVSLTEDPVQEIPVARKLVEQHSDGRIRRWPPSYFKQFGRKTYEPASTGILGSGNPPAVVADTTGFKDPLRKPDLIIGMDGGLSDRSGIAYTCLPELAGENMSHDKDLLTAAGAKLLLMHCRPEDENLLENVAGRAGSDTLPVLCRLSYRRQDEESFMLKASSDISTLLLAGYRDGFWIDRDTDHGSETSHELLFGILQACGARISA